jgi:L-malate glycosyltransferase
LVSAYEAFGLVLVEAMLHKLPVIATNVGGMQFIVDDNKTGYLVNKFDVHAISKKLTLLCDNVDVRIQFGENGYRKAIQNYTEERYVKNVEDLYIELIKKEKISEH